MDREFDIESKAVTALAVALFLGFNGLILAGVLRIATGA
jgi:hypothetical protein